MNTIADYIIIGAGSAGCVLAARLSEDKDKTVILVEAGGNDTHPFIHIPSGYIKTMNNSSLNWMYKNEPDPGVHHREIDMPRGKVLGGSSSINAMLYIRGQAADYDSWAQRGNPGWSYDDVLPYFIRAEHQERLVQPEKYAQRDQFDSEYHGTGGPLNVADIRERYEALDMLCEAAQSCGYPYNTDFNGASQHGFGYYQVTQKGGMRCSTRRGYLTPAQNRPNLKIITNATVTSLGFDSDDTSTQQSRQARTVNLRHRGQLLTLTSRKTIILSAGAIGSPQILELSGIGRPELLAAHGITPRHELSGVGENFSDHFISRLAWRLTDPYLSLNRRAHGLAFVSELFKYAFQRRGILSLPAGILGGFVKSHEGLDQPDIQYHMANASFKNPAKRVFDDFPGLTIGPCQLRPESRGYVHIQSSDPSVSPLINPKYLDSETDRQVHLAGMRIARKLMSAHPISDYVVEEIKPGADISSDDELLDYARATGVTLYHPVSTCRMGPEARNGDVVDSRLNVHGITGLKVVDASIMPELVSGNTNAPTIMIAEKAADIVKEEAR